MEETQIATTEPVASEIAVFGTTDPLGILGRAKTVADVLAPIVETRKLYLEVKGRKHVYVEGWTTMIAMLGVFPHVISNQRLEREDEIAYEAKVELRTLAGQPVGAGEALCSTRERNWAGRDEYAIKSMAQTRAVGKACRLSFSWLIGMAGYEAAPAEEMMFEERKPIATPQPKPQADQSSDKISEKQRKLIFARCKAAGIPEEGLRSYLKAQFNLEHTSDVGWKDMDAILQWIDNEPPIAE